MNLFINDNADYCEIGIDGRIEAISAETLYAKVCELADKGRRDIRVNANNVDFISSAGIRTMLQSLRKMSSLGGHFRIVRASYAVQQSLALSGLSNLITPGRTVPRGESPAQPRPTSLAMSDDRCGKKAVLHLAGRLDAADAEKVAAKVNELAESGISELEFDTGAIEYISSGGIRALLQSQRRMSAAGGKMHIGRASRFVLDALAMSGLSALLISK